MVYARSRMRGLCLVPAHLQAQESARRMGSYDRYPRVIRDALKEGRRRPSL